MKRKYYITKVEEIEADEPIFEKLVSSRCEDLTGEDFEETIRRLEDITGERVMDGDDPFQVGICGLYDENNEAVFEL